MADAAGRISQPVDSQSDWIPLRLKYTVRSVRNGVWGEDPDDDGTDVRCVRAADFDRLRFRTNIESAPLRHIPAAQLRPHLLAYGDLVLEKSGGGDTQPVGLVVLFDHHLPAVCSNFAARMRVAKGFDPRYLCYLHAYLYSVGVNTKSIKQNTGIQNLDAQAYLSERVLVAPSDEQRVIADVLDRETGKIDELVAKKQRLIELLEEKRTALISHAVSKGLNSDAPLRDSGIEWLGQIPKHWDVAPLKRMATRVDVGIAEAATHAYSDSGVPIIRSTNVRPGRLDMDALLFIEEWFAERNRSKYLHEDDIVTVRTGNAGVSAVVPRALERAQCFTLLMTTLESSHVPEFVCTYLNSAPAGRYFSVEGWGTAQSNISVPILQGIPVPIPPRAEQLQIVEFLRHGTKALDDLAAKTVAVVDRLTEYRSALITTAVTGQIDVCEYSKAAS